MRKFLIVLSLLIVSCSALLADERIQTVSFRAIVPDDYGVSFPHEALRLDRLTFQLPNGVLISEDMDLDAFVLNVGTNSLALDMLYYGNLEDDYTVVIDADSEGWLIGPDEENTVPVSLSFDPYVGEYGIRSELNTDGSITITVPATGARHANKVGTLILTWEYPLNLIPGDYNMELNLSLRNGI